MRHWNPGEYSSRSAGRRALNMPSVREGVMRTFVEIRTSQAEQTLRQQLLKACKLRMALGSFISQHSI
jgi:hypothetical protein